MALAVALTLHAACTGDDSDDDSSVITDPVETTDSTTSSSSSSTTETTVDPQAELEAEVEAAYLAFWDHYFDIFSTADPENPLIDELLIGRSREQALDTISNHVLDGTSIQPPENPDDFAATILDVDVQGTTATVRACVIDGSRVVDNDSGEVLNDTLATYLFETTLVRTDAWRLSDTAAVERREERWSCD